MTDTAPPLRHAAISVVRRLRKAGHTAYFAGGCVRDRLLGHTPKDYDVATDARPDVVRSLFHKTQYVGEAFGVVLVNMAGHAIEVATFRLEWGYADGRHPDHVEFTDAEHDARRRDFTINGLFEDPLEKDHDGRPRVIDFVGGRDDLASGIIRAIGDPEARFAEDYLRMLRAVRFAARLNFTVEPATAAAIRTRAHRLEHISRERIGLELQAMLTPGEQAHPHAAALMLQQLDLDTHALRAPAAHVSHAPSAPADQPPLPTLARLDLADPHVDYPAVLAAWMIDRERAWPEADAPAGDASLNAQPLAAFVSDHAPARITTWRDALCLSNQHRDDLARTLATLARAMDWPQLVVAPRKRLLADSRWPAAAAILAALAWGPATASLAARIASESQPLIDEGVAPEPWLTGSDLIAAGYKPGPRFGRWLDMAYDAQLDGTVTQRAELLDWLADRIGPPADA